MLKRERTAFSRAMSRGSPRQRGDPLPRGDPSLIPRVRGDPRETTANIRGQPTAFSRRQGASSRQGRSLSKTWLAAILLALGVWRPALGVDITNTAYVAYVNEAGANPQLVTSATSFTVTTDILPAAPTGLTAAARDGGGIGLSWQTAVQGTYGISGYLVYRASYPGLAAVNHALLASVPGAGATLYFDPAVVARSGYCYLVQAVDVIGLKSSASNEACAVAPVIPPGPPTDVSAALSDGAIRLSWTPAVPGSDPISGYLVFRATYAPFLPGAGTLLGSVSGALAAGFLDGDSSPGTLYHYIVRAVSIYGLESPDSGTASARALPEQEAGDIRLIVRIFDSSGRLVKVLLDSFVSTPLSVESVADGAPRALLERDGSLRIVLSDGTALRWDGLDRERRPAPNGFYVVRITNVLPDGRESVSSASFSLVRQYERLIRSALLVPNPARDTVWLSYELAATFGEVNVKIYAVTGELVYSGIAPGDARAFIWNLKNNEGSRVAAGLYIVVLEAWDPWTQKRDREVMKLAVGGR